MARKTRKSMRVIKKKKRSKNKYFDGVKTDDELVYSDTSPIILEEGYTPGFEPFSLPVPASKTKTKTKPKSKSKSSKPYFKPKSVVSKMRKIAKKKSSLIKKN